MKQICAVENCGKFVHGKGFCGMHYKSLVRYGNPLLADRKLIHGQSKFNYAESSGAYKSWSNMKARCDNPCHSSFVTHGAKGCTYDPKWSNFQNFYEDMGDRPEGYSLDRINNNKSYSKENCRWIPFKDQWKNRRTVGAGNIAPKIESFEESK
jgi:hypothetical protein